MKIHKNKDDLERIMVETLKMIFAVLGATKGEDKVSENYAYEVGKMIFEILHKKSERNFRDFLDDLNE